MAGRAFCGYNVVSATKEIAIVRTPQRHPVRVPLLLAALLLAGCVTTPVAPTPYGPRPVVELARWQVESQGAVIGEVIEFEIRDPDQPVRFYRVKDRAGRWLGHVTENGRFSRRVPFRDDEEDLGVYAMARGVALLFEAEASVQLKPVALEADHRKER